MQSQKLESVGRLAGGVAHNFRNILQAILGNAEYLQLVRAEDDIVKEAVSNINNSVDKGVDLIYSLLHFSKLGEDFEPFHVIFDVSNLDQEEVFRALCLVIDNLVFRKQTQSPTTKEKN